MRWHISKHNGSVQPPFFFNTVLGPDAGKAGGAVTGIPLEQLTAAWDKPFQSEDEGGCPALPIPLVV